MSHLTCIVVPEGLRLRAKELGINMSAICRDAIADVIEQIEQEEGQTGQSAKTPGLPVNTPAKECDA